MPENENASPMTAEIVEAFRKIIKQHEGVHYGKYFISTNKAAESCAEFFTQQLEETKRENEKQVAFIDKCSNEIGKLQSQLSEFREALQEITEVHNWLWENCERGGIHHNDFFNRNANAQSIAKELLTKLNSK